MREDALPSNLQMLSELAFPPPHPFRSAGTISSTLPSLFPISSLSFPHPSQPQCPCTLTQLLLLPLSSSTLALGITGAVSSSPPSSWAGCPRPTQNELCPSHTQNSRGDLHATSHQEHEWETKPLVLSNPLPLQQKFLLQLQMLSKLGFRVSVLKTKPHNLSYLFKRRPLLCPPSALQECPEIWSVCTVKPAVTFFPVSVGSGSGHNMQINIKESRSQT